MVEYRDYVADAARTLFPAPNTLRARWQSRVGREEIQDALTGLGIELARDVLDGLLDKYTEHGISQLDDLGVLEVPPISALGSPAEIADRFGSPAALRDAVETLGELLYAA